MVGRSTRGRDSEHRILTSIRFIILLCAFRLVWSARFNQHKMHLVRDIRCAAQKSPSTARYTLPKSIHCYALMQFSPVFFCILLLLFLFLHSFLLPPRLAIHRTRRTISAEPIKILRIISRVNSSPSVNSFDLTLVSSSNSGIQSMKKTK